MLSDKRTGMELKKHVLVVDDDEKIRKMLTFLLSAKGYAVDSAPDGRKALAFMEKNRPNLIILDLMMPFMDGFEVCETLRARGSLEKVPVIVLSAYPFSEEINKLIKLGVYDFVSKPFTSSDLLRKAGEAISGKPRAH